MSGLFINKNGVPTPIIFYKKTNTGQVQCPVFKKTTNGMERIDLYTKTKVLSGYVEWYGTYRSTSTTGDFPLAFTTDETRSKLLYQGKYGSNNYLNVMSFKKLLNEVASLNGTVIDAKITVCNKHAYSSTGLYTYICGAWNLPDTRPSTLNENKLGSISYVGKQHFDRYEKRTLTLESDYYGALSRGELDGFRFLSPNGFDLNNYGYFAGTDEDRPYLEITVEYQG